MQSLAGSCSNEALYLSCCLQISPGILQAPVGSAVSLAAMQMAGAKILLAWNEGLASLVGGPPPSAYAPS